MKKHSFRHLKEEITKQIEDLENRADSYIFEQFLPHASMLGQADPLGVSDREKERLLVVKCRSAIMAAEIYQEILEVLGYEK